MKFVDKIPDCSNVADGQAYVQIGCDSCRDGYRVEARDGSDEFSEAMRIAQEVGSYREVWRYGEDSDGLDTCDDGICDRLGRLADGRSRLENIVRLGVRISNKSSVPENKPVVQQGPSTSSNQNRVLYSAPYEEPPTTKDEATQVAMIVVRGGKKVVITRGNPKLFTS